MVIAMSYPISREYAMRVDGVEGASAERWRARAERARRFVWTLGEGDARRLDEYAAECEEEARRLECEREKA